MVSKSVNATEHSPFHKAPRPELAVADSFTAACRTHGKLLLGQVLPFFTVGLTNCLRSNSQNLDEITLSVSKGSPKSLPLFNIFMDVIAERTEPNYETGEDSEINLLADNVQREAKSQLLLQ